MTLREAIEKIEVERMKALRDTAIATRAGDVAKAETFHARAKALREAVAILMEVQR